MKNSFVSSVISFQKGGDEAKVTRFVNRYIKSNKKQISIRKDEISEINERLEDLNDKTAEDLVSVNLDAIKTADGIDSYINTYRSIQKANLEAKLDLKEKIEDLEAEIAVFEALNAQVSDSDDDSSND